MERTWPEETRLEIETLLVRIPVWVATIPPPYSFRLGVVDSVSSLSNETKNDVP